MKTNKKNKANLVLIGILSGFFFATMFVVNAKALTSYDSNVSENDSIIMTNDGVTVGGQKLTQDGVEIEEKKVSTPSASAPKQFNYTLLESFPGFFNAKDTLTDLPALVLAIYKFGIWTVGIAGLFMIVIGGIMYMGSAGNKSTAGSAKDIIWDAIYGIVGALTAYLFLYVINPDFTKMNFNFTPIGVYDVMDASNPKGSTQCYNCVSVVDMCKENPCSLNKTLADKLKIALQGQNARITEGWPATVNHSSSCHGNGTCADVNLTANKGDVQAVKKLYDAIKAAGLKPVYEDTKDGCIKYTQAGVYCHPYPTMTYPSFHVNM